MRTRDFEKRYSQLEKEIEHIVEERIPVNSISKGFGERFDSLARDIRYDASLKEYLPKIIDLSRKLSKYLIEEGRRK